MERQAADTPSGQPHDAAELSGSAYAGLVSRLAAIVLDTAIVTIFAAGVVGLAIGGAEVMLGRVPQWVKVPTTVTVTLLPVTYFTAAWWLVGQTLGGMTMGVAVRDARGRPLRLPRSLVRAAAGLALAPVWLLGMGLILVNRQRRSVLDVAVGTVVIYVPDRRANDGHDNVPFTRAG